MLYCSLLSLIACLGCFAPGIQPHVIRSGTSKAWKIVPRYTKTIFSDCINLTKYLCVFSASVRLRNFSPFQRKNDKQAANVCLETRTRELVVSNYGENDPIPQIFGIIWLGPNFSFARTRCSISTVPHRKCHDVIQKIRNFGFGNLGVVFISLTLKSRNTGLSI